MKLFYSKLLAAACLWFFTFTCSMLPLILVKRLQRRQRSFRLISYLSCFGGGVFIATCLLHLFPDVKDQIYITFKTLNINPNFPVAEFLLGFGFLVILVVEQIALSFKEESNIQETNSAPTEHSHPQLYQNYGAMDNDDQATVNVIYNENLHSSDHESHSHEISFHQDLSSHSILRSLLLLFALSLHSVFEGLAIGFQNSNENVIRILSAVVIHKCIIAFTLGLNLTHSKLKQSSIIRGDLFFSLTSPVGIIIGLVVMDLVNGLPLLITSSVLQGIAAGTFLYVTFFEVLPHELNSSENRIMKTFCIVLGFSAVSLLLLFFPS